MRILNLENCLAKTHLTGPGVRFNLEVVDPLEAVLDDNSSWKGLSGAYVIDPRA